jgi:Flp pilus assembly protein TadD
MTPALRLFWAGLALSVQISGCATQRGDQVPVEERGGPLATQAPAPSSSRAEPAASRPLPQPSPVPPPAGTGTRPAATGPSPPAPSPASRSAPAAPPPERASAAHRADPAVVALLNTARDQAASGDLTGAAASLERALRIDPQNPWTWYRLAVVRFQQGQLGQAEQFARKADTLAGTDTDVRARSWRLISLVREREGDPAGAQAARHKAQALSF